MTTLIAMKRFFFFSYYVNVIHFGIQNVMFLKGQYLPIYLYRLPMNNKKKRNNKVIFNIVTQ